MKKGNTSSFPTRYDIPPKKFLKVWPCLFEILQSFHDNPLRLILPFGPLGNFGGKCSQLKTMDFIYIDVAPKKTPRVFYRGKCWYIICRNTINILNILIYKCGASGISLKKHASEIRKKKKVVLCYILFSPSLHIQYPL